MRLYAAPIILLAALLVTAAAPAPAQATLEAQEMRTDRSCSCGASGSRIPSGASPATPRPIAAVLLALTARASFSRLGSARQRVAYGIYALCAAAFVPYLVFWNLIGFNY